MNSPLEQFEIHSILGLNLGWFDLSFTNASLAMIIVFLSFFLLFNFSLEGATIVPNR